MFYVLHKPFLLDGILLLHIIMNFVENAGYSLIEYSYFYSSALANTRSKLFLLYILQELARVLVRITNSCKPFVSREQASLTLMVIFRIFSGIWQFLEKNCLEFLRLIPGYIRNSVYSGLNPEYKFYVVLLLQSFYTCNAMQQYITSTNSIHCKL